MSTDAVAGARWNALRLLLVAVLGLVALGAAVALSGLGNPTHGWRASGTGEWVAAEERDGFTLARLEPLPAPPYMLEVTADLAAPWGLWLGDSAGQRFLVDSRGYIAYGHGDDWRPFIHVGDGENRLLLRVEPDRQATWRVNDEIAWTGRLEMTAPAGLLLPHDARTDAVTLTVYTRP